MWMLASMALAADRGGVTGPMGPEPVLEHASADMRHLNRARGAQMASIVMPGMMLAGGFALYRNANNEEAFDENRGSRWAAATMLTVGSFGMVIAPSWFQREAILSRTRLRSQGLKVRRTPSVIVPTCATLSTIVALAGFVPGVRNRGTILTVAGALYGTAFILPTLQMDLNRSARRSAGWLGVIPRIDRDNVGVQLVSRW